MRDDHVLRGAYLPYPPRQSSIILIDGPGQDDNMRNSFNFNADLQAQIDFVVQELRTTSGARVMAAAEDIASGDCDPDTLWERGKERIGMDTLHEGYIHDYNTHDMPAPKKGEPFFGYGISVTSHEIYLELHEHFGAQWLEKTLMAGAATLCEARALLDKAHRSFEQACARRCSERIMEIHSEMTKLMAEVVRLAS